MGPHIDQFLCLIQCELLAIVLEYFMFGFVNGAISVPHAFNDGYFPALSSLAHTLFAECEVLIDHWFFIDEYFLLPSIWRLDLLDRLDQVQIHERTEHPVILRLI